MTGLAYWSWVPEVIAEPVGDDRVALGGVVVEGVLAVWPGADFTGRTGLAKGPLDGRVGYQQVGSAVKDEDRDADLVPPRVEAEPTEDGGEPGFVAGAQCGGDLRAVPGEGAGRGGRSAVDFAGRHPAVLGGQAGGEQAAEAVALDADGPVQPGVGVDDVEEAGEAALLLLLSFRRSMVMAGGDGDHAAAVSVDRAGVRVVGEDDT